MLTKLPLVHITPAVPFRAGRPESVVCQAPPDPAPPSTVRSGYYARLCYTPSITVDVNGYPVGANTQFPICTYVWVDLGG